jgi:ribosome-binding factor A
MSTLRQQRVNELLKRALGEIFRRELPGPEAGLLTVNEVVVSGDLKSALVYVGVLGTAEKKQRSIDMLKGERARIQGLLARAVVLRYTPQLRFCLDESIERGDRVLAILDEIERSQSGS